MWHEGGYRFLNARAPGAPGSFTEDQRVEPGKRFLEVGCAGGALLKHRAPSSDLPCRDVELSDDASRMAREKFGVPVFTESFWTRTSPMRPLTCVFYMGDVIEHLPDPVKTLRRFTASFRRRAARP